MSLSIDSSRRVKEGRKLIYRWSPQFRGRGTLRLNDGHDPLRRIWGFHAPLCVSDFGAATTSIAAITGCPSLTLSPDS